MERFRRREPAQPIRLHNVSAARRRALSDETGFATGAKAVFGNNPTLLTWQTQCVC